MALLLITCPRDVVLQPLDWWIPPSTLVEGLLCTDLVHHSLPVDVPARSLNAGVDAAMLTEGEMTASSLAPSFARAEQTLLPLPPPAPSSLDRGPGAAQEEVTIDSSRDAKPAPASASTQKSAPGSGSDEKRGSARNRWNKEKAASSSASACAAVA